MSNENISPLLLPAYLILREYCFIETSPPIGTGENPDETRHRFFCASRRNSTPMVQLFFVVHVIHRHDEWCGSEKNVAATRPIHTQCDGLYCVNHTGWIRNDGSPFTEHQP